MGEVADVVGGGTPESIDPDNFADDGHPWITPADLSDFEGVWISSGRRWLTDKGLAGCSARLVPAGTVLMSSRAPIGYVAIAENELCTNQGFKSFILSDGLDSRFVFYWLRFNRGKIEQMGSGSTFMEVSGARSREIPIVFPCLPEQKRIVAKVEELLGRVNAARARLAKVPVILKRFRQAVLAAACSGQLTAEWREQQGTEQPSEDEELPAGWDKQSLRDVCDGFEYGSSQKSGDKGDVPVLRMGNLQDGKIDWADLKYSSDAREITKYSLAPDTVLFNRTNSPELVGKTAIYRGERPAIFAGYLIRIVHGPQLDPGFLNYCLNEQRFREYCMQVKSDGVSQSNINAKKLANYEVALPPITEQREIVRRVEALFALADQIETHVRAATVRAERLPQAILARAFRGELVPTEAELAAKEGRDYEPASALLERIQEARKQHQPVKRARGDKNMARRRTGRQPARSRRPLDEVLREQGKSLTPERLFDLAGFDEDSVDVFYEQLRKLVQDGRIHEERPNKKDVYLEAAAT